MDEWLIIYRSYDSVALAAEIVWLQTQIRNPYNAQTEGNRSYARSTQEFRSRLAAAIQVQGEGSAGPRHGSADFSCVQV